MKTMFKTFLVSLVMLLFASSVFADGKKVAIVIGNSKYSKESARALKSPRFDAQAMANKLKECGFKISGNGPLINANRNEMLEAIEKFAADSKNADVAIFYYSGHAASLDGKENLLMPVGEKFPKYTFKSSCVELSMIKDIMKDSHAQFKVIFLDACRNNPFEDPLGKAGKGDINKGLARDNPIGFKIAFATQAGAIAKDGTGTYSPFTEALLQTMDIKGLTWYQFESAVIKAVEEITGDQTPEFYGRLDGNFTFIEDDSIEGEKEETYTTEQPLTAIDSLVFAAKNVLKKNYNYDYCINSEDSLIKNYTEIAHIFCRNIESTYNLAQKPINPADEDATLRANFAEIVMKQQQLENGCTANTNAIINIVKSMAISSPQTLQATDMGALTKLSVYSKYPVLTKEKAEVVTSYLKENKVIEAFQVYKDMLLDPICIARYRGFVEVISNFLDVFYLRADDIHQKQFSQD